jgi:methyltransferase (TIGR00027 family)
MNDALTAIERPGLLRFLIKFLQIILYVSIQIVFIPLAIIGLVVALYKELWRSKQLSVSFSAIKALQYRWMMHYFNTRPDSLSVAFTRHFPCESHFGMWSILGALIISVRLSGFPEKLGKLVEPGEESLDTLAGIRVLTFDRIMQEHVDDVDQVVLLGSGFDLIAHHLTKGKNVAVFEIDQVHTLNMKVETLQRASIECGWITYIPVDFSNESWDSKLLEAGFERSKRTLFLWQSVSLYLEPETVRATLLNMGNLCAEGSIIAQDFYSQSMVDCDFSKAAKKFKGIIEKMGEPWKFGLDMSDDPRGVVESYLNEVGLQMTEYIQFGEKRGLEGFYCIVEAEKLSMSDSSYA